MNPFRISVSVFFLLPVACVSSGNSMQSQYDAIAPDVAAKRAAFDLSCPQESLQVQNVGQGTWGVTGCGKKATYGVQCSANAMSGQVREESCSAILNSPIDAAPVAPSAAAEPSPELPEESLPASEETDVLEAAE